MNKDNEVIVVKFCLAANLQGAEISSYACFDIKLIILKGRQSFKIKLVGQSLEIKDPVYIPNYCIYKQIVQFQVASSHYCSAETVW